MTDKVEVLNILRTNKKRNNEMFAYFNPVTGEGSIGERFRFALPDFPIPTQYLPVAMKNNRFIKALCGAGSVGAYLESLGVPADDEAREELIDIFNRLRIKHDFPYWCATLAYIKDKDPGKPDCLFRLNFPQRKYATVLEDMRTNSEPIRICMCKARQWGGSTETDLYMAWLQLVHRVSLNGIIIAHVNSASEKIKAMYKRMLDSYPTELLYEPGESFDANKKKLVWDGNSDNTQRIPQRNCTLSVGSSQSPNSSRSGDYALAHFSEIGLFQDSEKTHPEDLIRSATAGILYRPYTMIVYESTADGVGTFFHKEYKAAEDGTSQFKAFFVAWYEIENYRIEFADDDEKMSFAQSLFDGRNNECAPSDRAESGQFLWWLWQKGASLEAINWYITERKKYSDHGKMAAEFPSDAVEAFVNSGANVFDKYQVEALRHTCRAPFYVGDVYADGNEGEAALRNVRFSPDSQGALFIWAKPEIDIAEKVLNRYLTVVDIGGRSDKADWSVITVFDRFYMMDGGKPSVAAQWRGHIDIDLLCWKAAQIAAYYDDSYLVIESNTADSRDPNRHVEGGDQSLYLLNQLASVYPNMYARQQSPEEIRAGEPRKWGFSTNVKTKPEIITNLVKVVREALYTERDSRCLDEMAVYLRNTKGIYAAAIGSHDDILMTRAIGMQICFNEMELPKVTKRNSGKDYSFVKKPVSAATIG